MREWVDKKLWTAVQNGNSEKVQELLSSLAEEQRVNAINTKHYAASEGLVEVVTAILECIADEDLRISALNTKNRNGSTALTSAAYNGHDAVVTAILNSIPKHRHADVLYVKGREDSTALDIAMDRGNASVLKALKYADAFCRNLSIYQARKEGLDTIDYAQQLLDDGKLSLWDRLYLFLTGHFKLAFAFSNPKVTKEEARGSQAVPTGDAEISPSQPESPLIPIYQSEPGQGN